MVCRTDLEARLRALRTEKRSPASSTDSSLASSRSRRRTDVNSSSSPLKNECSLHQSVAVATEGGYSSTRCGSSVFSAHKPVEMIRCCSSDSSTSFAPVGGATDVPSVSKLAPAQEEILQVTAAQLLGSDYEEAVNIAQYAMESERRELPHTAIGAYIRAGQMLIEIGRRQAAPHLQEIVKAKALALLQRAEGLSEWTNEVLAKDSSHQALTAAYQQSQQNRNKSLTAKQELVAKMQRDNRNMKERLNQLALLTKIRGRLVKVVRTRRARKAAEVKKNGEIDEEGTARKCGRFNNVTGDIDDDLDENREDSAGGLNNVTGSSSDEDEEVRTVHHHRTRHAAATGGSPREAQKVGLINELHERIGLPRIDQFREFEPLTHDARTEKKQEQLQFELEEAKQEADKLRAAVQEMERCLQLAAQHSKQRSMKLEQQKAQEVAEVQSELDLLRKELEAERRWASSLHSSSSSWRSSLGSDRGSEETKDARVMDHLRSSLHQVLRGRDEQLGGGDETSHPRDALVQHTFGSQHSPRHAPTSKDQPSSIALCYDVKQEEIEDDGGVWL